MKNGMLISHLCLRKLLDSTGKKSSTCSIYFLLITFQRLSRAGEQQVDYALDGIIMNSSWSALAVHLRWNCLHKISTYLQVWHKERLPWSSMGLLFPPISNNCSCELLLIPVSSSHLSVSIPQYSIHLCHDKNILVLIFCSDFVSLPSALQPFLSTPNISA